MTPYQSHSNFQNKNDCTNSEIANDSKAPIPMYNHDGTVMLDHRGNTVYRSQFLSTHPLRTDCKERVGYGGRKLFYLSGEGVIRTMNAVFGHTGWSSEIVSEKLVVCRLVLITSFCSYLYLNMNGTYRPNIY